MKPKRALLIAAAVLGASALSVVGFLAYAVAGDFIGNLPMEDGHKLADGRVTTVVDSHVACYLVDVGGGKLALVDACISAEAEAVLAAVQATGATADDVIALFVTHSHADHTGGAAQFPGARVYALQDEIPALIGEVAHTSPLHSMLGASDSGIRVHRALQHNDVVRVGDTDFHAVAHPGHTVGNTVYVAHGVAFLGDSAGASSDHLLRPPPWIFTSDMALSHSSLQTLPAQLHALGAADLAFGHTGSLKGLDALWAFTGQQPPAAPAATALPAPDPLVQAVQHPDRPEEDTVRDQNRKPAEILRFFGVAPGMKVADIMTARGYYGELLARAVGPTGSVIAHNNRYVLERFAEAPLTERLKKPGLEHVRRYDAELDALELASGELDLVLIGLFYHDTVWMEVDRQAMNQQLFAALRPGGVLAVIDHHAEAGSGLRDVKTLHRIDRQVVVEELTAAGFVLLEESELLRHPEDDRTVSVFDDAIRGRTDRFVLKFQRP